MSTRPPERGWGSYGTHLGAHHAVGKLHGTLHAEDSVLQVALLQQAPALQPAPELLLVHAPASGAQLLMSKVLTGPKLNHVLTCPVQSESLELDESWGGQKVVLFRAGETFSISISTFACTFK